jgi:hypothetical protein
VLQEKPKNVFFEEKIWEEVQALQGGAGCLPGSLLTSASASGSGSRGGFSDKMVEWKDFFVHQVSINFGKDHTGKANNPVDRVKFFNPKDNDIIKEKPSAKLPQMFTPKSLQHEILFLYLKDTLDDAGRPKESRLRPAGCEFL